jgi:hypothetical protein
MTSIAILTLPSSSFIKKQKETAKKLKCSETREAKFLAGFPCGGFLMDWFF